MVALVCQLMNLFNYFCSTMKLKRTLLDTDSRVLYAVFIIAMKAVKELNSTLDIIVLGQSRCYTV